LAGLSGLPAVSLATPPSVATLLSAICAEPACEAAGRSWPTCGERDGAGGGRGPDDLGCGGAERGGGLGAAEGGELRQQDAEHVIGLRSRSEGPASAGSCRGGAAAGGAFEGGHRALQP
jgi:hypothetical protein